VGVRGSSGVGAWAYGFREDRVRRCRSGVASLRAPERVPRHPPRRGPILEVETGVLDIVYLLGTAAVFVLTAWIGRAVEKL